MADQNNTNGNEASKEFLNSDEAVVNTTKRQRKASTLYENEYDPIKDAVSFGHSGNYQKRKPAGNKKRSAEENGGKSAVMSTGAASSSSGTKESKKNKHSGSVSAAPAIVVIPAREREQQSVEEEFMRNNKGKMRRKRVPMPIGASDPLEFPAAIKKSVKDCSTLLLDWNQSAAKLIGATCKVYWEGDNEWFYGRILNYDQRYDRHFVYYFADDTSEWLSIRAEAVFVAEAFVLASMRGIWPALRYWASPKAQEVSRSIKGYHKNCEYVEFFSETEAANSFLKEYAFLSASSLEPLCEQFFPAKPHKSFNGRLEAARKEQLEMSSVQDSVVQSIRKALFDTSAVVGSDWLGVRVRASTHRVFLPDEQELAAGYSSKDDTGNTVDMGGASAASSSSSTEISSKMSSRRQGMVGEKSVLRPPPVERVMVRCIGTIVRYCASASQHLVVFDDALLQPQWVRSRPDEIDVLLGPEASEYYGSGPLRSTNETAIHPYSNVPLLLSSSSSSSSSSSNSSTVEVAQESVVVCMMCNNEGCVAGADDEEDEVTEGVSSSHAASDNHLSPMKQCISCSKYCHHHCLPKNVVSSESSSVVAESENFVMRGSGYTWQSYCECEKEERETKTKGGNKTQSKSKSKNGSSSSNNDAPMEWMCFDCIKCEGCGENASAKELLHWNVKRVSPEKSFADRPIVVCADCMLRFKEKKEYCPVCYVFYDLEDYGDDNAATVTGTIAGDEDAAADSAAILAAAGDVGEKDVFKEYGAFSNDRVRVPSSSNADGETAYGTVNARAPKKRGKGGKGGSRAKVSTVDQPCAAGESNAFVFGIHFFFFFHKLMHISYTPHKC